MSFRLQKLLSFVEKEEELIKQELYKIRQEKQKVEEEIQKTKEYLKSLSDEIIGKQINGAYLNMILQIKNSGERYINTLNEKLEDLNEKEETILESYLEKRKQRRSLEKLKERFKNRENIELRRKENKIIDEIAERKHFFGGNK